jgi:hypothetical protein
MNDNAQAPAQPQQRQSPDPGKPFGVSGMPRALDYPPVGMQGGDALGVNKFMGAGDGKMPGPEALRRVGSGIPRQGNPFGQPGFPQRAGGGGVDRSPGADTGQGV